MTAEDKKRFYSVMVQTADMYGKKLTKEQLRLYFSALGALSILEFERAAASLLATSKFMPVPADFYEAAGKSMKPAAKSWKSQVELWWAAIIHTMGRYGAGRSVSFDDTCVNDWIRTVGGWPYLCQKSYTDLGFAKRAFADYYIAAKENGFTEGTVLLRGEFESEEPPVRVRLESAQDCLRISNGTPANLNAVGFSPLGEGNEQAKKESSPELG